jgi:hypothetical protein
MLAERNYALTHTSGRHKVPHNANIGQGAIIGSDGLWWVKYTFDWWKRELALSGTPSTFNLILLLKRTEPAYLQRARAPIECSELMMQALVCISSFDSAAMRSG